MRLASNELISHLEKYGIKINNSEAVIMAFTHSSYNNQNYERFEFLGDSVLKILISEYLFNKYPNEQEGRLTALRGEIVSDKTLSVFARKLHFEKYVLLGRGEKRTGRSFDTILACVFEALLGAIYSEEKKLDTVKNFLISNFSDEINEIETKIDSLNPKATLQEYVQKNLNELPVYNLIEETGPDHNKIFKVNVTIGDKTYKTAEGTSKKEAQKNAAQNAIDEITKTKGETE